MSTPTPTPTPVPTHMRTHLYSWREGTDSLIVLRLATYFSSQDEIIHPRTHIPSPGVMTSQILYFKINGAGAGAGAGAGFSGIEVGVDWNAQAYCAPHSG